MAAGYARSSGRVGVFLVTSGPGRDQLGHADPRLPGRLDPGRPHHAARCRAPRWAPTRSRKRRSSTSWRPAPSTSSCSPTRPRSRRRCARAFDIARSGRPGPGRGRHPARRAARRAASSGARACCRCAATRSGSTRSSARRISAADARGVLQAARRRRAAAASTPAAASSTATRRPSCAPSPSASASRS